MAQRINKAGSVVIMCGAGCRDAADLLRDLVRPIESTPDSFSPGQRT
jgi:diaminopimelate epimerase